MEVHFVCPECKKYTGLEEVITDVTETSLVLSMEEDGILEYGDIHRWNLEQIPM
jgi:hypothetical protein